MATLEEKFSFQLVNQTCAFLNDSRHALEKWNLLCSSSQPTRNLDGCLQVTSFSFNKRFQSYERLQFCTNFLQDYAVQSTIKTPSVVLAVDGQHTSQSKDKRYSIEIEDIPCTSLNVTVFDKLQSRPIVRASGSIHKCFHEDFADIPIDDELRKVLLLEDSDHYDLYTEGERSEFLFRIFTHICIGGPICQFEDDVQPYLDATKQMYKDLVSVVKDGSTSQLCVVSHVFKVAIKDGGRPVFPGHTDHLQNFCYLVVDPTRKTVLCVQHSID